MNADIFSLGAGEFSSGMKLANVTSMHKKVADMIKVIINLLAYCLTYQKPLKDVFTSKFLTFVIPFCQNVNAVSGKNMCAALFNSPTREMARKYRPRTRIWYSSN